VVLYLLTHFGGPVLSPLDGRLRHWIDESAWLGSLRSQAGILSFVLLTQVPCLLVSAGAIRWRLRGSLTGVRGYLLASVFTVATALILVYGAAHLIKYSGHIATQRGVVSHYIR
jgi:hypothetical protein